MLLSSDHRNATPKNMNHTPAVRTDLENYWAQPGVQNAIPKTRTTPGYPETTAGLHLHPLPPSRRELNLQPGLSSTCALA